MLVSPVDVAAEFWAHYPRSTMSAMVEKTYNGNEVVGVVLRSKAKTVHFLRHAEGLNNEQERLAVHTPTQQ